MTYIRHGQDNIINYDTFCPIPYKSVQKANKYGMMYVGKTKVGQLVVFLNSLRQNLNLIHHKEKCYHQRTLLKAEIYSK